MSAFLTALVLALSSQLAPAEAAAADPFATGGATAPDAPEEAAPATEDASQISLPADSAPTVAEAPAAEIPQASTDAEAAASFADDSPAASSIPSTPPPAESSVLAGGPKPAEFMSRLMTAPVAGQLSGVAITLGDAMTGAADRATQTQRAEAYWDLSAAVGQYYVALAEQAELASLRQAVLQPAAAWDGAAADIIKRVEQTKQTAAAAQLRLHRLMGDAAGASLPLPADAPHCGRYNTRYEEIFVARMDPAARQLNEMLPLLHGELVDDVRQIAEATEWLNYVSDHRDPKTDGVGLLRAYELMALRRREFVETAHQYNLQIAAYTELAAPDQVESNQLVSMMIRISNPGERSVLSATGADEASSGVTPASATEPVENGVDADAAAVRAEGAPRTFSAWRPLKRLLSRDRERSIVVRREFLRLPNRGFNQD